MDDMDAKKEDEISTPHEVLSTANNNFFAPDVFKEITNKHLAMIANQAKKVDKRTQKKFRSKIVSPGTINIEISPQSFVSEKSGRFSDYYRIISRIGEGGYGQVFKVQNKNSGLIRAMKSTNE